jgi:TonB family protein
VDVPPQPPVAPSPPRVDPAEPRLTRASTPPRPANGDGHTPGKPTVQANPAQPSDSDSDPFARIGSSIWRDGRLDIRMGRKVKTTRPRILLAGEVDLFTMEGASVVLKIAIDASGNVTDVDILKSSGYGADIDQPCRVAVYDWWFEPTRDKSGRPVPDVLTFTIKFQ